MGVEEYGGSSKIKNKTTMCDPAILLLSMHPKEMRNQELKEIPARPSSLQHY